MAIKGKSKPKARRSVTPGPRPVYVPVKPPLLRRRGFQVGVVAVLLVAAVGAIVYGVVRERNQNHAAEQKRLIKEIASAYTTRVQTAIAGVGQAQSVSFTLLPDMKTQIQALRSGSGNAQDVAGAAKGMAEQASAAADALGKIDPASIIRGKGVEDAAFVRDLINAKVKMQSALRMEAVAAGVLEQAATAANGETGALLDRADEARTTAESLFQSGYSDWSNAQYTAGIFQPAPITPPGS